MAISFDPESKSYSDGVTTLEIKDGVYEIDSIEKLKLFRDAVNAGHNFSGQTVKLTQSIDLQDEEWTPIGRSDAVFSGTFDGDENTISNLTITKELSNTADNNGIGFFGYTNAPAKIVNLNIENVDITGSLYIGAIVGYGFTGAEISNCHVSGDVEIEGWWYIGGIGGNGYVSKVDGCTVTGNEGSYIKGIDGSYVGGIWGYRGEGSMAISDSQVVNIDISGVDRVGGICGIAHYGNTIEDCEILQSSITTSNNIGNTGVIAGANLGNADNLAILINNKADEATMGSVTIEGSLVENPPLLGANDNAGNPGKAAIVGNVTLDENGKITGGTVTVVGSQSASVNVNEELPMADNTKFYTMSDGTLVADETGYVAEVNGTLYKSLTDAIAAAGDNATITLVDNVTLSSKLNLSSNLTFDLGGFTLSGAVVLSEAADVTFKNGNMTAEYSSVTSNAYAVVNVTGSAALTLDGVNLAGADTVNKGAGVIGIVYQSTGALNVSNSTVAGGNQIHDEGYSGGTVDADEAIYAYASSGGTINIVDSTVKGGSGKTDAVYSGSYKSGLYVNGGVALHLGGTAAVTISGSSVIGGDSDWRDAEEAVNVSNSFNGTLLIEGSSTVKGGDALNLSNENRGSGGNGIYVNQSTGCSQITVNDSEVTGGNGGRSWDGSAIELNSGTPEVVFNNSSLTVGQGANSNGNAGAIRVNSTNKVDLTLNGVTMDGAGNGNEVIKVTSVIRDGGIAVAGENTIAGGTLEDVTFVEIADGTTFKTTGTGQVDPTTITNSTQVAVFDEETGLYVFEPVETSTDNVLVNSDWSSLASGTVVSYDGKHYRLGTNAFTNITDAVAATEVTNKITVLDGSYSGDQFFDGRTVEIGTADTAAEFSGYVFGGAHNNDSGDISMTFVNGSAGRVYGALFDQEGDYTVGDISINVGENVTLTERAGAAKVDKGSLTTGDVVIDFSGTAVPLFGGAQVWYKGSSAVHESVTINFSGNLSDVIYAAGQAMHGGSIVVNNGVTVNVTGGNIGTDGLMGGGFTRSDIANTDTAGSITINGGTWINISGDDTEITDVYGGTHTYSLNGALEAVSTITGGTHINMTGGTVGNVQGGGYTAWGSTSTIDSTYVSVSGGTVDGDVQGGSYVVGGGKDKDSGNSSTITNGTTVVISGSADIQGSVYGGSWVNWATGTAASYIQGVSSVTVEGGSVAGNVAGGGVIYANSGDGATSTLISESSETIVSLTGGTVGGDVYGGAVAADNYRKIGNGVSSVEKSSVSVDGAVVKGDIYAGGMAYGNFSTQVESTATVTVTAGTIEGDIYGGGLGKSSVDTANVTIDGTNVTFAGAMNNIYGGGNGSGDGYTDGFSTVGNATVTLTNVDQGDSMVYVYGGGVYGTQNMNSTKVTVTDSNVWAVYGGLASGIAGSAISGTAEVTVSGSNISGDVYGGTKGFQTTVGGTAVTINDGSVVKGSVYGGGLTGKVDGDVAINIAGATVEGSVNLGGGTVTGAASLTISGGNNSIAGGITANGIAGLSTIDVQDGSMIAGVESNGDVAILGNGVFTAGISAKSLQATDGLSFEVTKDELASGALVELTGDAASSIGAITVKVTDGDLSSFDMAQIVSGNVDGEIEVTLTDGTTTVSVESATDNLLVSSEWSSLANGSIVQYGDKYYQIGVNAFGNLGQALKVNCNAADDLQGTTIKLLDDISFKETTTGWSDFEYALNNNLNITADNPVVIDITKPLDSGSQNYELILISKDSENPVTVTFGENVTLNTNSKIWLGRDDSAVNYVIDGSIIQTAKEEAQSGVLQIQLCEKSTAILNGSISGAQYGFQISGGTFTVSDTGNLSVGTIAIESGRNNAHDAGMFVVDGSKNVTGAALTINETDGQRGAGYQAGASLINGAEVILSGGVTVCDGGTITIDGGSVLNAAGDVKLGNGVAVNAGITLNMTGNSSMTAAGFTADAMVSIALDSSSIKADSFDNSGFTMLLNGSTIDAGSVTVNAGGSIMMDYTSLLAFDSLDKSGFISVISTGYTAGTYKLFDYTGEDATAVIDYKSLLSGSWNNNYMVVNNDLYITDQNNSVIYVNSAYTEYECDGYIYGYNAFSSMDQVYDVISTGGVSAIELQSDITMSEPSAPVADMWMKFHDDVVIDSNVSGERRTVSISGIELLLTSTDQSRGNGGEKVTITIGENVDINTDSSIWFGYYYGTGDPDYDGLYSADIVLNGNINMSDGQAHIVAPGTTMTINETGSLIVAGSDIQTRGADLIVNGTGKDMAQAQVQLNHQNIEGDKSFSIGSDFYYEPSASWTLNNTFVNVNTYFGINTATDSRGSGVDADLNMNNSKLVVGTDFTMDDSASVTLDNDSELIVGGDMALGYRKSVIWGASIKVLNGSTLTVDGTLSTKAKSEMMVSSSTLNANLDLAGEITFSGNINYDRNIVMNSNTGRINVIDGNMTLAGGSISGNGIVNIGDFNDSTAAGSLKITDGAAVDLKGTFYVGTGSETFGANASILEIDASAGEFKVNNGIYVREDGKVLVNGHSGATFSNINVGGEFEMIGADSVSTGISAGRNTANGGAAKFIMTDSNLVDNAGLEFGYKLNRDVDVTMENSSITVQNGRNAAFGIEANGGYGIANVTMNNSSLAVDGVITIGAGSSVAMDYTSSMKFSGLTSLGTMAVDTTGYSSGTYKIFDYTGDVAGAMDYNGLLAGVWNDNYVAVNDDLYITDQDNKTLYVNPDYSEYNSDGYIYGYNAFSSVVDAVAGSGAETAEIVIAEGTYADSGTVVFTNSVNVNANNAAFGNAWSFGINSDDANDFNMDTAAKFVVEGTLSTGAFYTEKNANVYLVLNGDLTTVGSFGAKLATQMDVNGSVTVTPPANGAAQVLVYGTMNVTGTLDSTSGSMGAVMMIGNASYDTQYGKGGVLNVTGADASVTLRNTHNDNTPVIISALSSLNVNDGASFTVERGGIENNGTVTVDNSSVTLSSALNNYGTLSVTGTSVIDADMVSSGAITVDSALLTTNSIANSGNMTITWDSTVTFSEFTNSGTITVDWTGYDTVGRLLLDCVDNSWTVDDYKALLGAAWDDAKFTVSNGDLWLKSTVVYVNTEYGEGLDNDGHLWGINAFADIESAKAAAPESIVITGGEITDTAALEGCVGVIKDGVFGNYLYAGNGNLDATGSGDSVLVIEGGTFNRVYGGNRIEADFAVNSGDITLNISGGEFNSVVSGSGHVTSGYARRSGEINVSISGGTFHTTVAGGICLETNEVYDVVYTIGSINFEISGGTFEYHIYGGNVSAKAARSSQTFVDGDINLTIDASQNAVNIIDGCNVVAGSSGYGTVVGNVNVTIKGDKLNFNGILSGGSEGAHYYIGADGSRTCNSYVDGTRSVTFSNFNGNFDGRIVVFENISFVDNSNVVFTNTGLSLSDISEWNFEFGSSVSGLNSNDFTGDTMNLDLTGWDQLSSWDVMDGTGSAFSGLNDLASVTIGGQTASWDDNLSSWCSSDYQLGIREEEGKEVMFVSKLA